MNALDELYRGSLALLTDLYQLTMAYGYWRQAEAAGEASFHLFFRRLPFAGGYAVAAGLETALQVLERFRFEASDLDYLSSIRGNDGAPLFESEFIETLGRLRLSCEIDAVPEGTLVFAHEPLLRVSGPILECQILETILLNIINFQTLIATKAARICQAAGSDPVLEFGLRRAQGIDGGLSASRAAYLGGCAATSNVLAGKLYGIPVRGTHAHSWVMSFDTELESFETYARTMPNNCVFLVDTYDTLEGVRNAIRVGQQLRESGHAMVGIRLDSGDLAYLSIEARRMLDEAGFADATIVASNDLDEWTIESLKHQGATVGVWGIGTRLVTGNDQPALGGVYKLTAVRHGPGKWTPRIKISEQLIKTSIPGILQVRRFEGSDGFIADMIYEAQQGVDPRRTIVDPQNPLRRRAIDPQSEGRDLLEAVFRNGSRVAPPVPLTESRARAKRELSRLHPGTRRFLNPHGYPVGIDVGLHELRARLIDAHHASRRSSDEGTAADRHPE
ncbi:nicotinate phosphoribosyltransferase [Candidatus Laterigemmans baculatus]|uniref:nicotinate phosphoribosyltransferase n=1 Tax=Candidatus Laterigemmans baculatus TaxID=2770505 RepID=UPI0013D9B6DD|nr:nicotinate phosphoribosyltransferase [Candidatus Laterigemmans baculatus]